MVFKSGRFPFFGVDTTIDKFQRYFFRSFRGGIATPSIKLFTPLVAEAGFKSGFAMFDLQGEPTKYFKTRTPYTELFLAIGQGKEQFFRLIHTQNISRTWNAALSIDRITSDGMYLRQNAVFNSINLTSNFLSKNNRYSFLLKGTYCVFKRDENGGIKNDSAFMENELGNRKLIGINLAEARTRTGVRSIAMEHFFYIGKPSENSRDTAEKKIIVPASYFSYTFSYADEWHVYDDKNPQEGYYINVLRDTLRTLDSTFVSGIYNRLRWRRLGKHVSGGVSYLNSIHDIRNKYLPDSTMTNHIVSTELNSSRSNRLQFDFLAEYIANGPLKGDYGISTYIGNVRCLKGRGRVSFKLKHAYRSAEYLYTKYASNHFEWVNEFEKLSETEAQLTFYNERGFVAIKAYSVFNFIYFDTAFLPVQHEKRITIGSVGGKMRVFRLRNIVLDAEIWLQKPASSDSIIRLPLIYSDVSMFYEDYWFKKASEVQVGIDLLWYSPFYSDAYMPALRAYYQQQERQTGGYPYIDFFFNMKIRYARLFFKVENVTAGLFGYDYFSARHYPSYDRIFKFGVSMKFWD
ncbi:MAG: putative porin [Bacteroidota bacterium]